MYKVIDQCSFCPKNEAVFNRLHVGLSQSRLGDGCRWMLNMLGQQDTQVAVMSPFPRDVVTSKAMAAL